MRKLLTRDNAWFAVMMLLMLLFVFVSERMRRLADQVDIYENPAQIQILETPEAQKMKGPLPAIKNIECRILPCGEYTGRHRQCVVACDLIRNF